SGLPLAISVSAAAAINGSTLTAKGEPGLAIIRIEQAGNDIYCAVNQSYSIQIYDPDVAPSLGRWIGASWKSWSPGALEMLWNPDEKNYQITTMIPEGSQEIKFTDTNNWAGEDWGAATGLSGLAIKTTDGGDNIKFSIDVSGSYLIEFNPYTLHYSIEKI
ncbi:MAG: dextranase, partial [Cellvibrio sp.]|nr:dextranase [Cellvibrio sp.]